MEVKRVIGAICAVMFLSINLRACGARNEQELVDEFALRMADEPIDYFVKRENELRCCTVKNKSVKENVMVLCSGYGFDFYTMDDDKIEYIYRFSEAGLMKYNNKGTLVSFYSTDGREIACISSFTDNGVELIKTYEKRLEDGAYHYYKGVTNKDSEYVGECCLSHVEGGSIITASTFNYDGQEITEQEFNDGIMEGRKDFFILDFADMVPYEGPYSKVDWDD